MPVLVLGADHPLGEAIALRLSAPDREIRAFVSSPETAARLREAGIKVAIGDLSDEGHIAAACTNCFGVVAVEPALHDRDLAFATADDAAKGWAAAASDARIKRMIWVGAHPPSFGIPQSAVVGIESRTADEIADEVAYLDDLAELSR